MKLSDKLVKLSEKANLSQVAVGAGLPRSALSNAINSGQIPRADRALKIARAFSVPLDWLMDDTQDWPPPESHDQVARGLPDLALISMLQDRIIRMIAENATILKLAKEIEAGGDLPNITKSEHRLLAEKMKVIVATSTIAGNLASWIEELAMLSFDAAETIDRVFGTKLLDVYIEKLDTGVMENVDKYGRRFKRKEVVAPSAKKKKSAKRNAQSKPNSDHP